MKEKKVFVNLERSGKGERKNWKHIKTIGGTCLYFVKKKYQQKEKV